MTSVRGTRILTGDGAKRYRLVIDKLTGAALEAGFEEIILSSLSDQQLFVDKAGPEVLGQMYAFSDKGGRGICLIPEATAVIQRMYREEWQHNRPKPLRLFYVTRCYRYERPQADIESSHNLGWSY